jgi:hypothetical protein
MGVNAQTSVPAFTAGQVLTAAEMTQVNTGIPVFATTVTRDAAFDGAGEKVLAEGQYAYIEASNATQFYDGSAWSNLTAALTYVNTFTGTNTAAINCTGAFSSAYQNYRIIFTQTAAPTGTGALTFRLRSGSTDATTNYSCIRFYGNGSSAVSSTNPSGTDDFFLGDTEPTFYSVYQIEVYRPFDTAATNFITLGNYNTSTPSITSLITSGQNTNSTSYDGFSIITTATGMTGNVRVYGYTN